MVSAIYYMMYCKHQKMITTKSGKVSENMMELEETICLKPIFQKSTLEWNISFYISNTLTQHHLLCLYGFWVPILLVLSMSYTFTEKQSPYKVTTKIFVACLKIGKAPAAYPVTEGKPDDCHSQCAHLLSFLHGPWISHSPSSHLLSTTYMSAGTLRPNITFKTEYTFQSLGVRGGETISQSRRQTTPLTTGRENTRQPLGSGLTDSVLWIPFAIKSAAFKGHFR